MKGTNLLTLVVTLTLGIILAGSLLVPVVDSTQNGMSTTYTNEGAANYTINGVDDMTMYNTGGRGWVINGVEYTISAGGIPLITTDVCRFYKSDSNGKYMQLYGANGELINGGGNATTNLFVLEYSAETHVLTFTKYTDMTDTEVSYTTTFSCTHVIEYNPAGAFTAIITTGGEDDPLSYYVHDVNQIYAGGAYTTGDLDTAYFAQGTTVNLGESTYTGSAAAVTEKVAKYTDLLHGSTYTVTIVDGEDSESFTPFTVFVPKSVVAHTPNDNGAIGLLGALPIIVIMGLVVAATGAIFVRRND